MKKGFAEEISAKDLARIVEEGGRVEAVADAEDGSTDDGANEGAGSADAGGEG